MDRTPESQHCAWEGSWPCPPMSHPHQPCTLSPTELEGKSTRAPPGRLLRAMCGRAPAIPITAEESGCIKNKIKGKREKMTLKSCLICSTVRESSFPERGRRLDMWHWGMLLTPSWPSTVGHLQAAPRQGTRSMAALGGRGNSGGGGRPRTWGRTAGPCRAHDKKRSLNGGPTKGLAFARLKLPF